MCSLRFTMYWSFTVDGTYSSICQTKGLSLTMHNNYPTTLSKDIYKLVNKYKGSVFVQK